MGLDATRRRGADSQVAVRAVGAPAQVVLKVFAWRARALLEHVVRYQVLWLLRVPVCVCGVRREGRVGAEEARGVGGVSVRPSAGCGRTVSREGRRGIHRLAVRAEGITRY
jgi:hypothetical protein